MSQRPAVLTEEIEELRKKVTLLGKKWILIDRSGDSASRQIEHSPFLQT